jgi:hypothetical protein
MFLFLPLAGWVIYFLLKFMLAYIVGLVALPVGLIKFALDFLSAKKAENNIKNNLES